MVLTIEFLQDTYSFQSSFYHCDLTLKGEEAIVSVRQDF